MSISAEIQKYERHYEGTGHVVYFIKVTCNGRQWAVRKRYRDFLRLDDFLRRDGCVVEYPLPPKAFWKRFNKKKLEQRRRGLQHYLKTLLRTAASDASLLREFFEVEHNELQEHIRAVSIATGTMPKKSRNENVNNLSATSVSEISLKSPPLYTRRQQILDQFMDSVILIPICVDHVTLGLGSHASSYSVMKRKSLSFTMKRRMVSSSAVVRSPQREQRSTSTASTSSSASFVVNVTSPPHLLGWSQNASTLDSSVGRERRLTAAGTTVYIAGIDAMTKGSSTLVSPQCSDVNATIHTSKSLNADTLRELMKKEAYREGTEALWQHYAHEIEQALSEDKSLLIENFRSTPERVPTLDLNDDHGPQNSVSEPTTEVTDLLSRAPVDDLDVIHPGLGDLVMELDTVIFGLSFVDSVSDCGRNGICHDDLGNHDLVTDINTATIAILSKNHFCSRRLTAVDGIEQHPGAKHHSDDSLVSTATCTTAATHHTACSREKIAFGTNGSHLLLQQSALER